MDDNGCSSQCLWTVAWTFVGGNSFDEGGTERTEEVFLCLEWGFCFFTFPLFAFALRSCGGLGVFGFWFSVFGF
jgi:hypothetical protein